jgi:hypothetical protein
MGVNKYGFYHKVSQINNKRYDSILVVVDRLTKMETFNTPKDLIHIFLKEVFMIQ